MRRARRWRRYAAALGMLLAACPGASALDPTLDISQFAHTAWTVRDGFFKGAVQAIAQTPDGYLWIGTEYGLLRFDGVRFVTWEPLADEHLPSVDVEALLGTRDGRLWIGTRAGLVSWKEGRLTHYPELDGQPVFALLEDHQGTVWVGSAATRGKLCAIRSSETECYGEDGSFGGGVVSLYEYQGELWAGAATGLWRLKPGSPRVPALPSAGGSIRGLTGGDNDTLWMTAPGGIEQLIGGRVRPYPLPAVGSNLGRLLRDREGGLWIGTFDRGLVHLHQGRTDVFSSTDGLSGELIISLFEDREGNIWAATNNGLDRFRDYAVPTISLQQGLSGAPLSVLAARDGSVWMSGVDGLNRWSGGQITIYRKRSGRTQARARQARETIDQGLPDGSFETIFEDGRARIWIWTLGGSSYFEKGRFVPVGSTTRQLVSAVAEESPGNLWVSDEHAGLFHWLDGKLVEQIPWSTLGHQDDATALIRDGAKAGLWLGFYKGGLAYFTDGKIRQSYSAANGLGAGWVTSLQLDRDGTLWAATQGGLSRVKDGRITTLAMSRTGLACDGVHWVLEDDAHSFWLYTECGLARIGRSELEAWGNDPKHSVQATIFDSSDGVRSEWGASGYTPHAAKSADGKLWFATKGGVSVIDPRRLAINQLPPPVYIERITADRKPYPPAGSGNLRVPPLVRDLQIEYTALSLVAPEKMRFRYKLEGRDRDWTDAGNRRQAFYTDLPPRRYRFRVAASNNSGVWNEVGASLDFSIEPAYYQTTWFLTLVVAAVLAFLAGLYQLRLRYLKHQFNIRLEARVGERIRIARVLHDTLLQSFQGVLLKFSTVKYLIRSRPDEVEETLERYMNQARTAITEGRDAVQGLRSSTVVANDLARAITSFGEGLRSDHAGPDCPEFRLYVEGKSRDLPPLVRDEVYKVACECLRNAFRHAQARRIEVQIGYDPRQFRLQLVDNGKGIDPAILSAGEREGHHGLPGLRERAELAGGKLSVWSQLNSGTEIELTIPAAIAYTKSKTPAAKTASATNAGKGDE